MPTTAEIAGGTLLGGTIGVGIGAGLDELIKNPPVFNAKPSYRPSYKPQDCPAGTIPINQHPDTKGDVHGIKDQLRGDGVGPTSWVGVSPEGDIIVTNPDGTAENLGPVSSYQ